MKSRLSAKIKHRHNFRLQGFVLLWRHNGSIISVGDQVIGSVSIIEKIIEEIGNKLYLNQDSRYSLEAKENGNNLIISLAESADEGNDGEIVRFLY